MTINFYIHSNYVLCARHTRSPLSSPGESSSTEFLIEFSLFLLFLVLCPSRLLSLVRSSSFSRAVCKSLFFFDSIFRSIQITWSTYKYFSVFLQARVRVKLPYECHLVLIAYCAHKNNKNRCYRVRCMCVCLYMWRS